MNTSYQPIIQEEWIKMLGKGMVTLPKQWRDELSLDQGNILKAKKIGKQIILEVAEPKQPVSYRVYSDEEIEDFIRNDAVSSSLKQKIKKKFAL